MSGLMALARPSMLLPCVILAAILYGSTSQTVPQSQEEISSVDDLSAQVCQNSDRDQCGVSLLQRNVVHGSAGPSSVSKHGDPAALVSSKKKVGMTHNIKSTEKSSQGEDDNNDEEDNEEFDNND